MYQLLYAAVAIYLPVLRGPVHYDEASKQEEGEEEETRKKKETDPDREGIPTRICLPTPSSMYAP